VFVGNTGITSAATLSVGNGLTNTGYIQIEGGSASATGNLTVTGAVTTSGIVNLTNAFGDLTASNVNVTGGELEGIGTVTGAVNNNGGGTVVGGSQGGATGTLTVSGAYNQSGAGILQADINTGDTQQSSIVNVTGPGNPGAPGSVNLTGGTLLVDAETALALNTPYTVMTFGAGHLYGLFSQVETTGALGNNTGNGTSVNVTGGTLQVLYNEASGTVQVELVATPAATAYTWNASTGTWNTTNTMAWNPPNNGTVPGSNSDVTIGTNGPGTVTLAQDETLDSLSITSATRCRALANRSPRTPTTRWRRAAP
jgi:hypothetical protein